MIRIEVSDLDAWWEEIRAEALTGEFPGVRIRSLADYPWGREVHLIDLAGVCWHVGEP